MWSRLSRGCEAGCSPVEVGGGKYCYDNTDDFDEGGFNFFFSVKLKGKGIAGGGWIFHDWCLRS